MSPPQVVAQPPSSSSPAIHQIALPAPDDAKQNDRSESSADARRDAAARQLVNRVTEQIALGPAYDAKVRQRTWVGGREVVGVGTYEQAGRGTGQYNLQVTMHDGDGRHSLQQVSDGRLAWTRQQIGDNISLRRVDVGRLDQWVAEAAREPTFRPGATSDDDSSLRIAPSMRVGGVTELLTRISADHEMTLVAGTLESREVWIVNGKLRDEVRQNQLQQFATGTWPELVPTRFVLAVARTNDLETKFGQGLPLRLEFWTDPVVEKDSPKTAEAIESAATPRLVSLLEWYSIRPISPPPVERFRFDNQDSEVNFVNETDSYLAGYGVHLTERQQRELIR